MPGILDIIDKRTTLRRLAADYYKTIQEWYAKNDSGHMVHSPMNVPAHYVGDESRPHQHNSFILARHYYEFCSNPGLDLGAIEEFLDFLSLSLYGEQELNQLSSEERSAGVIVIPDQFVKQMRDFKRSAAELKRMIETYNETEFSVTSTTIDFRALLHRHMELLNHDIQYNGTIIKAAYEKARAMQHKSSCSTPLEMENTPPEFEMGLDEMIQINDTFQATLAQRAHHFSWKSTAGILTPTPLTEVEKIELLCGFFQGLNSQVLDAYYVIFKEEDYENSFLDATNAIHNEGQRYWSLHTLWSEEQQEHHEKFAETLNHIGKSPL